MDEDGRPEDVASFYEGVQAGVAGEDPPLCEPCEEQPIDALFRKGKGKGKGKRSFTSGGKGYGGAAAGSSGKGAGGGNSATAAPPPGVKDTRICHWCLRRGHVIRDCRDKAAGKPKAT